MKVLVTGSKGQLGYDVIKRLELLGIECLGTDINEFDLTNKDQTINYIKAYQPDVVIHCAAYTAVDKAEENLDLCYDINVNGTEYVALACQELNCKLVYISTDYVFDGKGNLPFGEEDKKDPINHYGLTKSLGEDKVRELVQKRFVVRISWVFGINGHNFVKTMLRLGKEKKEITVVSDQIGSPTYTFDLAVLLTDLIQTEKYGIYHATNEGICSWFEFATEIMKLAKLDCVVKPIFSDDYKTLAKRPYNSRMSKQKLSNLGFNRLPDWHDALKRYITELNNL